MIRLTEEEIDQFVQDKVYGVLLPWEKNPRARGSCNTFRAQEVTLRAIIRLQQLYGRANRNLVMRHTGYSKTTHQQVTSHLCRKGALERKFGEGWSLAAGKRSYTAITYRCPHASP